MTWWQWALVVPAGVVGVLVVFVVVSFACDYVRDKLLVWRIARRERNKRARLGLVDRG